MRVRPTVVGVGRMAGSGENRRRAGGETIPLARTEAVPAIPCYRTIPASIYNSRLLIAGSLIALRSSCRELIPRRDTDSPGGDVRHL